MPNLLNLRAEIEGDPLTRGYSGMTNDQIADSLNVPNRLAGVQGVSLGDLNKEMDNMADAQRVPAWEKINAGALLSDGTPEQIALGMACRSALRLLREARADYPGVNTRSPTFGRNVAALVTGGVLTLEQGDDLKALSDVFQTRAQELKLGSVSAADVARAKALR